MNSEITQYDIVIVGAGLVGASLACAIAQQPQTSPLRIAVIEAHKDATTFVGEQFDPRVVALTHASETLLQDIGVWDDIVAARTCAYRDMHVWDGEGTAQIHFNCADVRQNHLGHIVEQAVVSHALLQKIQSYPCITLIQPARVTALNTMANHTGAILSLNNNETITTALLIAADGAQSSVRELAQFETREWDYNHTAIITTIQTQHPHQFTAWQRFMHTGPLAYLPLPSPNEKHFCSIVWSTQTEVAHELMALTDAEFCAQVASALEHKLGDVLHTAERFAVPLRQRHAKHYIQPCVALVGDAAHNIHPLAGQGVNLGLLDVAALAAEIERARTRGLPLYDFSILRRYQRQRITHNLAMMSAMEAFKRLFGNPSLMLTLIRNIGMRKLNSLTEIKKVIIKTAMGVN